jgi:hypothetical protein
MAGTDRLISSLAAWSKQAYLSGRRLAFTLRASLEFSAFVLRAFRVGFIVSRETFWLQENYRVLSQIWVFSARKVATSGKQPNTKQGPDPLSTLVKMAEPNTRAP